MDVAVKRAAQLGGNAVWLYGVGKVATAFYERFERKYPCRIRGFLVSDASGQGGLPQPVVQFDAERHWGNDLIIVCVSPKFYGEIERLLMERHVTNYIFA